MDLIACKLKILFSYNFDKGFPTTERVYIIHRQITAILIYDINSVFYGQQGQTKDIGCWSSLYLYGTLWFGH